MTDTVDDSIDLVLLWETERAEATRRSMVWQDLWDGLAKAMQRAFESLFDLIRRAAYRFIAWAHSVGAWPLDAREKEHVRRQLLYDRMRAWRLPRRMADWLMNRAPLWCTPSFAHAIE